MSDRYPVTLPGQPEFSEPLERGLSCIEAASRILREAGQDAETVFATQTRHVMGLAAETHAETVLRERDDLWNSLVRIVGQNAVPSLVTKDNAATLHWIFCDRDMPLNTMQPNWPITSVILTNSIKAHTGSSERAVLSALECAERRTRFDAKPDPILGVAPQKVGILGVRKYQFPPQELRQRAIETALGAATAVTAVACYKIDPKDPFARHTAWQRPPVTIRKQDYSAAGLDTTQLSLSCPGVAYEGSRSHVENLSEYLREEGHVTPRAGYAYLHDMYITSGLVSLEPARQIVAWLGRDAVMPQSEDFLRTLRAHPAR